MDTIKFKNEINLEQIKKIELDILVEFHKICEINNLRYSLSCGTLLGAIRHKGFIPWDDDIDVMMPRDDYEKLMNIYSSNYKNSKYSIINHHNNNSYFYPIAKMYNNEFEKLKEDYKINTLRKDLLIKDMTQFLKNKRS